MSVKQPTMRWSREAMARSFGASAAAAARRWSAGSARRSSTTGPKGSRSPSASMWAWAVSMIQRLFASASSLVAPQAVIP